MMIRNKIALIFTLLTACILLGVFAFIYYFANRYKEHEFSLRLKERAKIAAEAFLKEDEVSVAIFDEIRTKHLHTLPGEQEYIFPVVNGKCEEGKDSLNYLQSDFFDQISERVFTKAQFDETYYVGILYKDNQGDFIVIISADDMYGRAKLNNLRNILLVAFGVSLGIIYIVGLYYARQVLVPISGIINRVNNIRASNLHLRLDSGNEKDELAQLAITFNNMLDRLETSFEIQSNFVNNASHELKNPLTAILGEVELALKKTRQTEDYVQTLNIVEKEAQRLDQLVNSLLRLAQADYDNKGLVIESVRVDELLINVKNDLDNLNPSNYVIFDFTRLPEEADHITIQGNQSLLKVALTNVIHNACKFSANKEVLVRIEVFDKNVMIIVKDKGVGIPANELKNILETFYRASNVRGFKGYGVGLPLTSKIVKLHSGTIEIFSEVSVGTEVRVTFPNQWQKITILR